MASVLGLDLGASSVRAVLLRTTMKKVEVDRYLELAYDDAEGSAIADEHGTAEAGATGPEPEAPAVLPASDEEAPSTLGATPAPGTPSLSTPSADGRPHPAPAGPRSRAIRHVMASLERPPDRVVICLPGVDASLRTLDLPAGAIKRVAEVLPFELEALLPFPADDAIIDHQPLERSPTELRLLACAAPKERVAARVQELTDAGVFPREMAVGAAALDGLATLLPTLSGPEPVLLLDVDAETADLCIVREGLPTLTRTLSEGNANLPRFMSSLRRTLASFRSKDGLSVTRGFILGSAAEDSQVLASVQEVTNLDLALLPLPEAPGGATEAGRARFGRAAALAARTAGRSKRLNLLRDEFAPQHAMGALRRQAPLFAACAVALVLMLAYSLWARYVMLSDEQEALQAQLVAVTESAFGQAARTPRRAAELLEGGGREGDPLPRYGGYDLVHTLSGLIPASITHDTRRLNFELDEDGYGALFEIQGTIATVAERDQIVELLEAHECSWCVGDDAEERQCFREIERGPTTPGPGGQGLNYQLEAKLRCPNAPAAERGRRRRSR